MTQPHLVAAWAQDLDGLIAADGEIYWYFPDDLRHFRSLTAGRVVLVGRRTWEKLPPLPGREVVKVSRGLGGITLERAAELYPGAVVIGGGEVYQAAMRLSCLRSCVVTRVMVSRRGNFTTCVAAPVVPSRMVVNDSYKLNDFVQVDVWS